jgi:pilus assembly protein Flp/PilA
VRRLLSRFGCNDSGATSIEYALIAVGLSIVIVGAVASIGTNVNTKYSTVNTSIK